MSKTEFKVNISVQEVMSLLTENENADLVHEEVRQAGEGKEIGTLIFEKYYFRSKNRAALIVMTDNFDEQTSVRAVSTASSEGLIFNFDWGAADSFLYTVEDILTDYIVEDNSTS